MKLGVELVPYMRLERMVGIARDVERLGYDQLWVCDHYHNRFVYVALSQMALQTSRIRLGPGVTNPYLIHPSVTAAAVATLGELSGGRAMLGISAGDPYFLETVGVEHRRPVLATREAIEIVRGLLTGERLSFRGEVFRCTGAKLRFKPPAPVPVYVGGRRERMLELAGEIADGALVNASHPDDLRDALRSVGRGLGRNPREEFDRVAYLAVSVGSDVGEAQKLVRGIVAFIAASAPKESLEIHGIPEEEAARVRKFLQRGEVVRAKEEVTSGMIEAFSVCGRWEDLEGRVEEVRRLGFDTVVVGSPIGPEPRRVLERVSRLRA